MYLPIQWDVSIKPLQRGAGIGTTSGKTGVGQRPKQRLSPLEWKWKRAMPAPADPFTRGFKV